MALRPFRKQDIIRHYIQICADIGQLYTQGMVIAAALQRKTINDVLSQKRDVGLGKMQATRLPGSCCGCGLMGHQERQCPDRRVSLRTESEPGLCRRCRGGKHWTSECISKRDNLGYPLSGNGCRGQPRALRQNYGAIQQPVPLQESPFRTFSEQPQ